MARNKPLTVDVDFEIAFYEKLLQKAPDEINTLIPLGEAYTRKKLYRKGLLIDKKLVKIDPKEPIFQYNLACSLALLGEREKALDALEISLRLGYSDFAHIENDEDLRNLRDQKPFQELIAKYRKKERPRSI